MSGESQALLTLTPRLWRRLSDGAALFDDVNSAVFLEGPAERPGCRDVDVSLEVRGRRFSFTFDQGWSPQMKQT